MNAHLFIAFLFLSMIHCQDLCLDRDYKDLDDPSRGSDYYGKYCDDSMMLPSPDWEGPGLYRIVQPAGLVLPEHPVGYGHCSTEATGWLNGSHPTEPGETVERTVCFQGISNMTCAWQQEIQVTNCGDYFLYGLQEVPVCYARYCSSDHFWVVWSNYFVSIYQL